MNRRDRLVVRPCSRCKERKIVKNGKVQRSMEGVITFICFECELEFNENMSTLLGERVVKE